MLNRIVPNLWFDTEAEEAAAFYVSVLDDSRIVSSTHYTEGAPRPAGMVMTVEFELGGQRFVGINGGPAVHVRRGRLVPGHVRHARRRSAATGRPCPRAAAPAGAAG